MPNKQQQSVTMVGGSNVTPPLPKPSKTKPPEQPEPETPEPTPETKPEKSEQ
ncbi:hypothetical protein ES703_60802 [subsurface metagenome]